MNLALLTDGLRAEREQGITIDVAYRYFATPTRKFIIADTPGHIQYTRNMVTGASTADLALVLIDAAQRHRRTVAAPRVPRVAARRPPPRAVRQQDGPRRLRPGSVRAHPQRVPGVRGEARRARPRVHPGVGPARRQRRRALREHAVVRGLVAAAPPRVGAHRLGPQPDRLPLPGAVRHPAARRPLPRLPRVRGAGRRAAPTRRATRSSCCRRASRRRIASIDTADGPVEEATPPMSVTIRLEDELDVSRGDMICRPNNRPHDRPGHRSDALLVRRSHAAAAGRQVRDQAHVASGRGRW